jgi:hypothetical protein
VKTVTCARRRFYIGKVMHAHGLGDHRDRRLSKRTSNIIFQTRLSAHNSFKWPGEAHANNFQHGMQCCLRPLLSRMSPVSHRLISHPSITSKRHARDSNVAFAFKHLTHVEEPRGESALSNNPASQLCSAATRDRSGSQSSCETGASKKSS